ncbi:MAG: TIGR00730 family Rossman fold protein [Pseudomonadota bacterium]
MKRICVFCGSSPGAREIYTEAAVAMGRALVDGGLGLVYGGGSVGLMGIIARTVADAGGDVVGVIPRFLMEQAVGYNELADLRVTETMHERKALMAALSDGFVAMPGGLGTLEELFEVLTWAQLGMHTKPCGLLNVNGYFDGVLRFLDHAVEERFVGPDHRGLMLQDPRPEGLLAQFAHYTAPAMDAAKWALAFDN